jgi:integrative and conjugative element protein (TIGR02256 family)
LQGTWGQVIIPSNPSGLQTSYVGFKFENANGLITIRFVPKHEIGPDSEKIEFILASFTTPPITQRAVRYAPQNLQQLQDVLSKIDFDISQALRGWANELRADNSLYQKIPVIVVEMPKQRQESSSIEESEFWAFTTIGKSVSDLGEALGIFEDASRYGIEAQGFLIGDSQNPSTLDSFDILSLIVYKELSSQSLPKLSGYNFQFNPSIAAIGAGTLGSKIIELAARSGFGNWTLIDRDTFLPHNAVRHVLAGCWSGYPKAKALHLFINSLVPGEPVSEDMVVDIKRLGDSEDELNRVFSDADLILDMSASIAAAREICEHSSTKRRASLFLNPSGQDIVLLLESSDRSISLWDLEAGYYQSVVFKDGLHKHLTDDSGRVRYGNGCRDLTAIISADQVSTLSGIGLRQLIRRLESSEASAVVVCSDLCSGEVKTNELEVSKSHLIHLNDWRICWSFRLINELAKQRESHLPNETGGILLGIIDFEHKIIVVSAQIPAPKDSKRRPHYFERGVEGLKEVIQEIEVRSAGHLRYLGEWHSHPNDAEVNPSTDDEHVFAKLSGIFHQSNEPFIMAILGEKQLFSRFALNCASNESILTFP